MGLDKNGLDGSGAMEDESRQRIEEDLLRANPRLRYSRATLRQMVDAIHQGSDPDWRPSEAVNGQGDVNDSDRREMEGFLSNPGAMEEYRRREIGNKNIFPESTDPEDDRFFGENQASPGQKFVQHIQKEGEQPAPTQQQMEYQAEAEEHTERPWIRNFPAAGRFAARRTR
jgi:hypothetical protein